MFPPSSPLRFAFYADDFTGATDALERLALAGVRCRLFLTPPSPERLAREPALEAIGVAGFARSLAPDAMANELRPAFTALRALGVPHVHYKVCSTFDSSPVLGSIGRAIDLGAGIFGARFVPVIVAAPALGRYCAFGHLFARYGIGSAGAIYRLDRHPAISRHPVTPMMEADLCVHLAAQTARPIGLVNFLELERSESESRDALEALLARGDQVVLFDTLNDFHLARIRALLSGSLSSAQPLFTVGSSAVEAAFFPARPPQFRSPVDAAPTLILSGSCSPVTGDQIAWARANGFDAVLFDPASPPDAAVAASLLARKNTIVFTSLGAAAGAVQPAARLGTELGAFGRRVLLQTGVRRVVLAGGDTASHAARGLGIGELEILAPLTPGAPLCRAIIPGDALDGLQVICKGGQVGAGNFFAIAAGAAHP